jgi:hypothetical protein
MYDEKIIKKQEGIEVDELARIKKICLLTE